MGLHLFFETKAAVDLPHKPRERMMLIINAHVVSIACLSVTNARGKVLLNVVPNIYPASRILAKKDTGDESLVEYIQVHGAEICRKTSTNQNSPE